MSNEMSKLMSDWLRMRRLLREAEERRADESEVAHLDRQAAVAFTAWRQAVHALDQAA